MLPSVHQEMDIESLEAANQSLQVDLKLAFKRIGDLQAAIEDEMESDDNDDLVNRYSEIFQTASGGAGASLYIYIQMGAIMFLFFPLVVCLSHNLLPFEMFPTISSSFLFFLNLFYTLLSKYRQLLARFNFLLSAVMFFFPFFLGPFGVTLAPSLPR